jgi:hypothetical protein
VVWNPFQQAGESTIDATSAGECHATVAAMIAVPPTRVE